MPDQSAREAAGNLQQLGPAAMFAAVGSLIAVGQILLSNDRITLRLVIGRCISTSGLAMCAGASLAVFPTLPLEARLGVAAMLASLGTSALEMIAQRIFGRIGG